MATETAEHEDAFKSLHQVEKTTDEPLVRVMALHALAYCERLYYLEEVEEIRVADANVYAGRRMHEELDGTAERYTVEFASERLGIRGKLDAVRRKSGELVVYEHKKGKSRDGKEAWPGDRLQVIAYALLLAEHTGEKVAEACVRYHADNKLVTIPVDRESAESELREAVRRARELRSSLERPPVAAAERLCRTCSLAPVCLPEEERFAVGGKNKVQRLFPPEDDRIIHIVEQGSSVRRDGEQIVVHLPDGTRKALPGAAISALVLHGNVQISTQVIHFCAAREIGVHWLSFGGHYVGALAPGAGGVQRRNRQYAALQDSVFRAKLAARIATAKVENQIRYILRITRPGTGGAGEGRPSEMESGLARMRAELAALAQTEPELAGDNTPSCGILSEGFLSQKARQAGEEAGNSEIRGGGEDETLEDGSDDPAAGSETGRRFASIRGHEGLAGREYFRLLAMALNVAPGGLLYFDGRSRRPPRNPFNALLSFGYALLYRDCVAALLSVGLEPALGIFHTPRSAAYPLALDLMELFRVILWDMPLVGSVNRRQWRKEDFEVTGRQVWLNTDGRRKAIQIYESRKAEKWKHPVMDYSLSYARTLELEARLLEKEWSGQPGSFAKLRLR
ncbi:MAG: CRISPR-associated endonuclease Cas1 [Syntrophobacteraceae bacterium]